MSQRQRNKYRAQKSFCVAGHKHDSKREAKRCDELHDLMAMGDIADLECQPQFYFIIDGVQVKHDNGRRVGYRPDFRYVKNGRDTVEDVKGFITPDYVLRKAIFKALFPEIDFIESK